MKDKALQILQAFKHGIYRYLGEGAEGVVFTDNQKVYKVFYSLSETKLMNLKAAIPQLLNAVHLYKIEDIINFQGNFIMISPFENSEPIKKLKEEYFISFLVEMWQQKLIHKNIKPENFICANGILKLIDYELEQYSDNLFLNMCVRGFIYIKYFDKDTDFLRKLTRSAINNFDLPELAGVQAFVNKVFSTIVFKESQEQIKKLGENPISKCCETVELPFNQLENLETLFYSSLSKGLYLDGFECENTQLNFANYFEPQTIKLHYHRIKPFRKTVSLIIKTCPQDFETIYANIKHIVKQLSTPDTFFEKIVAIDTREKNFIREFTKNGTIEKLMNLVNHLIKEQVIDRYVIMPNEDILKINYRWFGKETEATESIKGSPISHLYAFEQAKGEYILEMDSDVIIARKDISHSFLEDMVCEMEKNENVVSVGFNICQDFNINYKPYFGFENGGFVPEVRMGLFHKQRFLSLRPLSNPLDKSGKWALSWYRSMHQKQKETGFCSIRGGDSRSFFIHPQNYRKTNADAWITILDRVESGYIPHCQQSEAECNGSYYDWTNPKRKEEFVIVCSLRNVEYALFLKMFCSVVSQNYKNWGMVIIDDASDNGLAIFIENIIKNYSNKITFIKNRLQQGNLANIYKAIHYFISNSEAIIALMDGNESIIGNTIFAELIKKYKLSNADAVIGKVYQDDMLKADYPYPVNFINPRNKKSNVWKSISTFRKYLFDSLELLDLKENVNWNDNATIKKVLSNNWLQECANYAIMIPIIEMSKNPIQMDYFTCYYERKQTDNSQVREKCIIDILNKPIKNPQQAFKGRKKFLPNFNKIEIDITYDCDLKCVSCNRSCSQVPTKERIELADIKKFVEESIELNKKWDLINILGGEPTLHADFETIIKYISEEYIEQHSSKTILQITSNGLTAERKGLLEKMKIYKNVIVDHYSFKTSNKIEYFTPFNDAPIDDNNFKNADYTKACWVTSYCGIGLNKYGYYCCSAGAGIDRILNQERGGIAHLTDVSTSKLQKQFLKFCKYCGNYKDYDINQGNFIPRCEKSPLRENIVSKSWKELYGKYKNSPP